jgi:DNA polymerase I-like protein with 3'-5' exonuclease and polymerase domains
MIDLNGRALQAQDFDPAQVPVTVLRTETDLADFATAVATATALAADTETYGWGDGFHGHMRVASFATIDEAGTIRSFVYDARDRDATELAPLLSGVDAFGWNATFDSRVTDDTVFEPAGLPGLRWFDGMLADAVLHAGRSGFSWYHGLAWAAKRYLGVTAEGKGTTQTSFTATDDLTDEQIRYAAADAVETLGVVLAIRTELAAQNLLHIAQLECDARPFLDKMERFGMPFDWTGWESFLLTKAADRTAALGRLAELTGGGQATLFADEAQPTWNPASDAQVKDALNRWSETEVRDHLRRTTGEARLLAKADRVDKDTLAEIGGELCEALLGFRAVEKILSTYGENLQKWLDADSRMHPQYLQVVGTDTGRLSSRNPNAQNFSPLLKKFFTPATADRVFVYADLSQAELRDLAHESGDPAMLEAFRQGRDIHVATAERMFGVDMEDLAESEPKAYKEYRSKAKTLNFGIVYGLGATALARRLTLGGVPTSPEEGKKLLASYLEAYPQVAEWLAARDAFVRNLADNPPRVDWAATRRLAELWGKVSAARKSFRTAHGRLPEAAELAVEVFGDTESVRRSLAEELGHDPSEAELSARVEALVAEMEWVSRFEAAVVVCDDGSEFAFASHTPYGRRRIFNVTFEQLLLSMAMITCQSRKPGPRAVVREFAQAHGLDGLDAPRPSREVVTKAFEDRPLRRQFVELIGERMGPDALAFLVQRALGDRISAMGNAYRNHPIQGGVSDIVLGAYARLDGIIAGFDDAWPIQTVHDSITIECHAADAPRLAAALKLAMQEALSERAPSVPAVADADIRTSLDDADVLDITVSLDADGVDLVTSEEVVEVKVTEPAVEAMAKVPAPSAVG